MREKCDDLLCCLIKDASSREDVARNANKGDLDNGLRSEHGQKYSTTEDEEGRLRRGRFERGTILVNLPLGWKVTWGEV
jgi:hypothetical protein